MERVKLLPRLPALRLPFPGGVRDMDRVLAGKARPRGGDRDGDLDPEYDDPVYEE